MPEETLRLLKADKGPPFYFLFYVHCLLRRIALQYLKNSNLGLLKVSSGHKSYPGENLNGIVSTDAAIYSGLFGWEQKEATVKFSQLNPAWGRGMPREMLSQPSSPSFPQLSQIGNTSCGSRRKRGDPAGGLTTGISNPPEAMCTTLAISDWVSSSAGSTSSSWLKCDTPLWDQGSFCTWLLFMYSMW